MAGKADKAVVSVISNLTSSQASQITKDIMRAKSRYAPNSRGTIAQGLMSSVGSMLQKGAKKRLGR